MPQTIRWKLICSISIPLLATYLGMLAWDYHRQRSAAMEQMQRSVLERAENAAAHVDARLAAARQLAESTAALIETRPSVSASQVRMIAQGALRQSPWIASVTIAMEPPAEGAGAAESGAAGGAGGEVHGVVARRGSGGPPRVIDLPAGATSGDWYARAKGGGSGAWSDPHREPDGDGPLVCTYGVPITVGGAFRGVAAVSLRLDELRQLRAGPTRAMLRPPPRPRGESDGPPDRAERGTRGGGAGGAPDDGDGGDERVGGVGGGTVRPFRAQTRPADEAGLPPLMPRPPAAPATLPSDDPQDDPESAQPLRTFAVLDAGGHVIVAPVDPATAATPTTGAAPPPLLKATIFEVAGRLGHHELADAARDALGGESRVVRVAGLQEVITAVADDRYHWIALAPIPTTGWALISVIPESETMAPLLSRIAQRGAFLLGGTVVLLLVVLAVSIRISRPIEQMAGAVDRLAAGDLDAQVTGITSRDELGRLAGGFNHMTRQLKSHVAALTEQTAAREKVESELRIARQIQTDMLPRTFPDHPEFDLHAVNLPASRVAGDFYDFFFTRDGMLTIVIADVSGKGVPAALLMAVTRTIIRNLAHSGLDVGQIAEAANRMLIEDTSGGMFVTMLLIRYDPGTGRLSYVNAGHPPAYRIGAGRSGADGGDVRHCCAVQSPLLGVQEGGEMGPFEAGAEVLARGESILIYTDGVTEARAPSGRMFGDDALARTLRTHASLAPRPLCTKLAELLEEHQSGRRRDDITMLALRRPPEPREAAA